MRCGQNDESFKKIIPKGYEIYKSIGTKSMKIRSKQSTQLNELHYMTRVEWRTLYEKKDGNEETVDFEVIYFTRHVNDNIKIFAYITGDEQKLMKEHGLI